MVLEQRAGGRIFERTPAGEEHDWGEVTAFEPPRSLTYLWHIRRDRADATEVEISFHELDRDRTRASRSSTAAGSASATGPTPGATAIWPPGAACCPRYREAVAAAPK